jgi:menaquinone-specific isochorismate synthase
VSSAPLFPPRLRIVSREIAEIDDLLEYADPPTPWCGRVGSWLVGVGSALRMEVPAADAATLADRWRRVAARRRWTTTSAFPAAA